MITKTSASVPCLTVDWQKSIANNSGTWSYCPTGMALRGLYSQGGKNVGAITTAKCCGNSNAFVLLSQCKQVFWTNTMKSKGWSTCPVGQYLVGLRRGKGSIQATSSLNEGTCCRYKMQRAWGDCKTHTARLGQSGWSECPTGYFAAGFYRKAAASKSDDITVIGQLKCCRPQQGEL